LLHPVFSFFFVITLASHSQRVLDISCSIQDELKNFVADIIHLSHHTLAWDLHIILVHGFTISH
jgi:hypothetical protein